MKQKPLYSAALSLLLVLLMTGKSAAQDDVKGSVEGGLQFGVTQYYGDINTRIFSWKQKGKYFGIHSRYNINSYFSIRGSLTLGNIKAADQYAQKASARLRNISMKTSFTEFSFVGEYNILGFSSGSKRKYPGMESSKFSPYVFAGFDFYFFTPKASMGGGYYKVKTLDTELGKSYSTVNLSIPIGIGVKYSPMDLWTFGFEIGLRKTFTDYLDDVSGAYPDYKTVREDQGETAAILSDPSRSLPGQNYQKSGYRGNPRKRDWYALIGFTITKKLYFKNY